MPSFETSLPLDFLSLATSEYMPSLKEKFPYTSEFLASDLRVFSPSQDDMSLAIASVENLKPYFDSTIDLDKNYDLLGVVFNAYVVNRVNRNDQIIGTSDALASVESFKYKFINLEHNRERIIGMITGYGFSAFGTDQVLTRDEVKDMTDPFNVFLKGFVWKTVNPAFAAELEACSDPTSPKYQKISASWEMGFKEFSIVQGGSNLQECQAMEIESLEQVKKMLKHFGGTGKDDKGNRVFMQMVGEVLPYGVGLTGTPAAEVKGVGVFVEGETATATNENDVKQTESSVNPEENAELKQKNENNISQQEIAPVTTDIQTAIATKRPFNMLITKLSDITDASLKEVVAADMQSFIQTELQKASAQWSVEKAAKDKELSDSATAIANTQKELETLKAQASTVAKELEDIKAAASIKAKDEEFQARMSSLDAGFDLEDADRAAIGEQIKDLDEAGFTKWSSSFSVFASAKKKGANPFPPKAGTPEADKAAADKAAADKTAADKKKGTMPAKDACAKASEEAAAAAVLENASTATADIPNNGADASTPTLTSRFAKAFTATSVKITR